MFTSYESEAGVCLSVCVCVFVTAANCSLSVAGTIAKRFKVFWQVFVCLPVWRLAEFVNTVVLQPSKLPLGNIPGVRVTSKCKLIRK